MRSQTTLKYHIVFFTNAVFNAAVFCTTYGESFFYFPKCNKKGQTYNKIKTSRPFWNAE